MAPHITKKKISKMTNQIMKIFSYLGIAFVLTILSYLIKSTFLSEFISTSIINIIITLMAINTATSGVITSKLEEISREFKVDFTETYNEIKKSLYEQIVLLILSIIILILYKSPLFMDNIIHAKIICDLLLTTIFIYIIDILRDTGVAIFSILVTINGKDKNNGKDKD